VGTILIWAIHLYRWVYRHTPLSRTCLFRESCSRRVEAVTRDDGLLAGLGVARWRLTRCRPGYRFQFDDDGWALVLRDGSVVPSVDASVVLADEAALLRAVAGL
jgi:putative component of membrane protein insertase Oxa1/YidC/SpoIIIJ protein YidD